MSAQAAPGLTAGWVNAWLAALGATVLVPGLRVGWSDDPEPHALFDHPHLDAGGGLAELIADHLPDRDALARYAIAQHHPDHPVDLARKVTIDAYRARCELARRGDPTLAWTVTDLAQPNQDQSLQTSPFYPAGPGTVGALHDRLLACRDAVPEPAADAVRATLAGTAVRVKRFGLGFDYRRITSPTDPNGDNWIDPVVETLAFYGLAFHPVRGGGRDVRPAVRGWTGPASRRGAYTWAAWAPLLDAPAVDALLDQFWAWARRRDRPNPFRENGPANRPPREITAAYQSVPFKPLASADPTRGYASERIT